MVVGISGLWLILFISEHCVGNLLLLSGDGGAAFNAYAAFMEGNPFVIYVLRWLTLFAFALHAFRGLILWAANRRARGTQGYVVKTTKNTTFAARSAAYIGTWILFFLVFHLSQFWWTLFLGLDAPNVTIDGHSAVDLYKMVAETFSHPVFVVIYVATMGVLGLHLWHGFQSAFQTFGLNHPKYTPVIRGFGLAYSIIVPTLFASLPIYFLVLSMRG